MDQTAGTDAARGKQDGRGRDFCGERPWGHLLGIDLAKKGSDAKCFSRSSLTNKEVVGPWKKKKKKREQVTPEFVTTNNECAGNCQMDGLVERRQSSKSLEQRPVGL